MTTVRDVLRALFPERGGELPYMRFPSDGNSRPAPHVPLLPFDLFAIAGQLLSLSGAYHRIAPANQEKADELLTLSPEKIEEAKAVATAWRTFDWQRYIDPKGGPDFRRWLRSSEGKQLSPLFKWWDHLFVTHGDAEVYQNPQRLSATPAWWKSTLLLFIAADEAAAGVGFNPLLTSERSDVAPWFETLINLLMFREGNGYALSDDGNAKTGGFSTLSAANKDIVCVLPKARTPGLGCTMRSLSHNLALMPPQGIANGRWLSFTLQPAPSDERHMNLLIVPFPYTTGASVFRPKTEDLIPGQRSSYFSVDQQWLSHLSPQTMTDFVMALAKDALNEVDQIHAVVFPELALNEVFYRQLMTDLPQRLPGIELLVAGVSDDEGRSGNFVNITVFTTSRQSGAVKTIVGSASQREKHHRWRLDRSQIIDYGLEGLLSPSLYWWEDIDLVRRQIDFAVVRSGSVVSALICEDLARVDPCQELIRSVGPSIIFALLMDAPQLKARWPARYATILAEDPGSAVLTVTSKGMMNRQDRLGIHKSVEAKDRVIALWRDDGGSAPVEIACPNDRFGVVLTLSGSPVFDESLDGRVNKAVAWRYASHRPVGLPEPMDFANVLGRDGLSAARQAL